MRGAEFTELNRAGVAMSMAEKETHSKIERRGRGSMHGYDGIWHCLGHGFGAGFVVGVWGHRGAEYCAQDYQDCAQGGLEAVPLQRI